MPNSLKMWAGGLCAYIIATLIICLATYLVKSFVLWDFTSIGAIDRAFFIGILLLFLWAHTTNTTTTG